MWYINVAKQAHNDQYDILMKGESWNIGQHLVILISDEAYYRQNTSK